MKRILPYIFGARALIWIVIAVAGIAGYSLRADSATPPADPPAMHLCVGLANPQPASVTGEPLPDSVVCDGAR